MVRAGGVCASGAPGGGVRSVPHGGAHQHQDGGRFDSGYEELSRVPTRARDGPGPVLGVPLVSQPDTGKGPGTPAGARVDGERAMKFFGETDVGLQRSNNEDAWMVLGGLGAAILADGMGGENCGEVGSAVTVETVAEYLRAPEADWGQLRVRVWPEADVGRRRPFDAVGKMADKPSSRGPVVA